MSNSLAQFIRHAIANHNIQEAVARLENMVLQHNRVEQELLRLIPSSALQASPLLLKARCEELVWNGDLLAAKEALASVLKGIAARTLRKPFLSALSQLAVVNLRVGHIHDAKPSVQFLRDEWDASDEEVGGDVAYALARGLYLLEDAGGGNKARHYYRSAIAAYDRDGETELSGLTLFELLVRTRRALSPADWEEGIVEFRQRVRTKQIGEAFLPFLCALRSFCQRQFQEAEDELRACGKLPLPRPFDEMAQLLQFRIAAHTGNVAKMHRTIAGMESLRPDTSVDLEWQFEWARIRFEWASFQSDWTAAQVHCSQARAICKMGLPPEVSESLDKMADRLDRQKPQTSVSVFPTAAEETTWRAQLFGQLSFTRNDHDVRSIHWKRKKTKELAVYLLLQPAFAAPREQIAEALFQGREPDKMDNQLYVAAHQLKHVIRDYLGEEGGVISKDGWIRLKESLIEDVDVEQYLALLRVGNQLWPADRELAARMYQKAEPLYERIAPDVHYVDWLDRFREHVLEKQCETLRKLGRFSVDQGAHTAAEAYFRRWIELEPLQEEAYQELLKVLEIQGKRSEAESLFKRLEKLLLNEIGAHPLPETRALMRR